jgi:hypothetical protein
MSITVNGILMEHLFIDTHSVANFLLPNDEVSGKIADPIRRISASFCIRGWTQSDLQESI